MGASSTENLKNEGKYMECKKIVFNIIFHYDCGHGWAEVPLEELSLLGISDKISGCSYKNMDKVYLEEDCDLSEYCKALKMHFPGISFNWVEKWDGDRSIIRSYMHYK
jgi:hypothetical protein